MASHPRIYVLVVYCIPMLSLLVHQHLELAAEASRLPSEFHSPPAPCLSSVMVHKPRRYHPPSVDNLSYDNPCKEEEVGAFRPTAPGHSPGMGNNRPPNEIID
nr:hypothetical protein CDL12_07956 [Ipomoea trifida]GMD94410.1 precursor of CEP12 [Ipomoea batatas]